jgi:hypothetical protein
VAQGEAVLAEFQPRREQWTRQRYQVAPPESLRCRPQLDREQSPSAGSYFLIGWMPRICYTVAWWTGGGSARGRWSEDATGAQQPACCRCWLISASLLSCRTRGCMACFWPLRPRCCWSACAPSSAAAFSSANIRRRYRQAVVADRGSRPCDNSRGAGWRGVVIRLNCTPGFVLLTTLPFI